MTVSLTKGQSVPLASNTGGSLTYVRMGLGWDAVKKKGFLGRSKEQAIDLDASAVLYDSSGTPVDQIWWKQLKSQDGTVIHTGDNRTGLGDGDDESIKVHLDQLPANVAVIVFIVNSFTGQNFSQIENAVCRLVDESKGQEICRYELSGSGAHTAQIMAKVARTAQGWSMTAIGAVASGKTFKDLLPAIQPHL